MMPRILQSGKWKGKGKGKNRNRLREQRSIANENVSYTSLEGSFGIPLDEIPLDDMPAGGEKEKDEEDKTQT